MPRIEIRLADLGMESEQIKFGAWLKRPGDTVVKGEDLYEVEADKATVVCEAEAGGVLAEQVITEGALKQGDLLGYLETE